MPLVKGRILVGTILDLQALALEGALVIAVGV